jgi:hypothetical protein
MVLYVSFGLDTQLVKVKSVCLDFLDTSVYYEILKPTNLESESSSHKTKG